MFSFASSFLSTPSARRATVYRRVIYVLVSISIHALCEEGDRDELDSFVELVISIHALCEEGDSTDYIIPHKRVISIHALCEEGDAVSCRMQWRQKNFYPRPLRGGRLLRACNEMDAFEFLSTPSARRATARRSRRAARVTFLSTPSARRATTYTGSTQSPT